MLDNILEPYCNFNLHNGCLNDIASDHMINKNAKIISRNTSTRVSNDLDPDQDQRSETVFKGYQQRGKSPASMQRVNVSIITGIAFRRQTKGTHCLMAINFWH